MAELYTRNLVLNMLTDSLEKGKPSHIILNDAVNSDMISIQDKNFISRLYLGTIEKCIFSDYLINRFSNTKPAKIKPVIRNILRMSIYQMFFMDSVPDHAVYSEALKLCDKRHLSGLKGYVNGLLRTVRKKADTLKLPGYVKASVPEWLYEKLLSDLGAENSAAYFDSLSRNDQKTTVRICGLHGNYDNASYRKMIIKELTDDGCSVEEISGIQEALRISGFDRLTGLHALKAGYITIQDLSSMLVAHAAGYRDNVRQIIDVCAAPGGKSLHLADMYPDADIIAIDRSEQKINLIEQNIDRLGVKNITTLVHDSTVYDEQLCNKADIVICDLPCSGLGTLSKKPDIKLRLKEEDLLSLEELQRKILLTSVNYLKTGGLLIYSTCTVNPHENVKNFLWLLEHSDLRPYPLDKVLPSDILSDDQCAELENGYLQLINGVNDMDGFFISGFIKA